MKELVLLGKKMSDVLHMGYNGEETVKVLHEINETLADAARKASGVRADQLANADLDDKPIVRLYWTTLAQMTQMVFMAAANEQSYYGELDG